ncbi:protease II [Bradyrhizobium sp. GM6.1]
MIAPIHMRPPLPRAESRIKVLHDEVTLDRYGWLRDTGSEARAYLEAENAYAEQATGHLSKLKADLIFEIERRRPSI